MTTDGEARGKPTTWGKNEGHELQELSRSLAEAQRLAQIGSWTWEIATDTVTWSDELYRINGCDPQKPAPGLVEQQRLYTPESWEKLQKAVQNTLATQASYQLELQVYRADGRMIWLGARGEPILDGQGKLIGLRGTAQDITERKQLEDVLRQNTLRFKALIEDSLAGYFRINREGCFEQVNPAWLRMHGYRVPDEVLGQHFALTQVGGDVEQAQKIVIQLMQGQSIPSGEFSRRNKDGSIGWHTFSAWPVYQNGEVVGLEGFLIDTTGHKITERVNEARLRLLKGADGQSLDEVLQATLDELEVLTESQIGFYHFLGIDQQTLTLQTWSTRTLREMCTAVGKGSHYSVAEAGVWVDAVHMRAPVIHNDYASLPHRKGLPDGHAAITRELVVPVLRSGMVMAVLGVGNKAVDYTELDVVTASTLADLAWEIAERKRMEHILSQSAREWQMTFDATVDAICLLDVNQIILRANRAMSDLFEKKPGELIGRQCWQIVHGTDQPIPECPILRMKKSLKRESQELTIQNRIYDVTIDPILDDRGAINGVVHIVRDVTERSRMQRSMKNEMDKLEFMNSMMVDRELRMGELKKEINGLLEQAGKPKKY